MMKSQFKPQPPSEEESLDQSRKLMKKKRLNEERKNLRSKLKKLLRKPQKKLKNKRSVKLRLEKRPRKPNKKLRKNARKLKQKP